MNIGLLDIDGYSGRKKQWGAHVYPNLALCKIAAYHKQQGDNVEWYTAFTDNDYYDFVYMSKIFNFTPDYPYLITNTKRIIRGGTGYMNDTSEKVVVFDLKKYGLNNKKITNTYSAYLPEEIDRMQPDYSIYPHIPADTAYGFLTRGCPNSCKWCVVPQKEGKIYPYMDIDEIAINGRNKIILMDNNILAAGSYAVEQLKKIIDRGYYVDFNQALDARLVTDEYAQLLAQIHWLDHHRIRFGCDTESQIMYCEHAISLIDSYGFTGEYFLYTMLNDNLRESYSRVHYWWERLQQYRETGKGRPCYAHAQPFRDPYNPNHHVPQWQKDMAHWCNQRAIFTTTDFLSFQPRKGFYCQEYFNN